MNRLLTFFKGIKFADVRILRLKCCEMFGQGEFQLKIQELRLYSIDNGYNKTFFVSNMLPFVQHEVQFLNHHFFVDSQSG